MNYEETREQVDMILERVKALDNAKKAEFSLNLLFIDDTKKIKTPTYISEGLKWLSEILEKNSSNCSMSVSSNAIK